MTTTTPNMNLVLPDVSITPGPQWATLLNAAYALIDSHDHSSGNGAQISPSGINITSDLTFNQNNATDLRTVRLYPNNAFTPVVTDKTCLYSVGGELHYIDNAGNDVQITSNGAIDISGAISSLSLKDSSFFIQYFGDTTRQFRFNASAIPTGTTRILSVPESGGNDTFVTLAATQTLINKTLTAPVISSINTGSTTFTLPAADGTANQALVTNGSAGLSFTTITSSSIANVAANDSNVVFTSLSNKYQICTPTAARTYTLPTTGIVAGDTWTFYNQSSTAANIITIQSSGANLVDYVLPMGFTQMVSLVNTPTSAAHWKVVAATSDVVQYTPNILGFGTPTGVNFYFKRNRDKIEITGIFVSGTPTATAARLDLPSPFTISTDVTKQYQTGSNLVGYMATSTTSTNTFHVLVSTPNSTAGLFLGLQGGSQTGLTTLNGNALIVGGTQLSFFASVPIQGWN